MAEQKILALDFDSLMQIDHGKLNVLLQSHLERIAQDCMDRPGDKTKRKVTIELSAAPIDDTYVNLEVECKSSVPTHRSRPYQMLVTSKGFKFNADFPETVGQKPLFNSADDGDEPETEERSRDKK